MRRGTPGGQEEMCERDAMQDAGEWMGGWGYESDCECLKETQKVLRRLLVGSKEKRTPTFLECPPHCSRLMRQGRERMELLQAWRQDKTWRVADGTGRLSSRRRNSKHRT